ncbi:MAG: AI-2E family transporter [Variovorax sp.]
MFGRTTPNWIVAIAALGAVLYWLRDTLAPFALALILWLAIDSLAAGFKRVMPALPHWLALAISMVLVLGFLTLVFWVLARNISVFVGDAPAYQARLEAMAVATQRRLGFGGEAWTLSTMLSQIGPAALIGQIAAALQAVIGNTVLILIYLAFLFPSAAAFKRKLPLLAATAQGRARVQAVVGSIRHSIQRYLMVQTLMSAIISIASYLTLVAIGLPYPNFWALLIFALNYIPTIGSIIAVLLPTLFALVQFPGWGHAAAVALGLHVWQFGIGTFVQPRVTGESMNLSTLVVVLSLAIWGSLWGVAGAFLAAPLTVLVMIVLAQFPDTRWIAALLSANGRPLGRPPAR